MTIHEFGQSRDEVVVLVHPSVSTPYTLVDAVNE